MHKIIFLLFSAIFLGISSYSISAQAIDLGAVKDVAGDAQCAEQAATLAKSSGDALLNAFEQYSANQALTADDLSIASEAYDDLKSYVSSGCAKNHLELALSQLPQ